MTSNTVTLTGTLDRWQQHGDTGWGRGTLTTDAERLTVVGVIRGARPGDCVEAKGTRETHPKYGDQFRVVEATVRIPDSVDGAVAWIASNLPQVGKRRARAMIDHFGGLDAFWKVVEDTPSRLAEIQGITAARAVEIQAVFLTVKDSKEHGSTLRGWGLTEVQIARCMAAFGRELGDVVEAIRADPYELYRRVVGFGWVTADAVARKTGIARDAPVRIRSALRHVLESHTAEHGHVFMTARDFQGGLVALLELDKLAVLDAIDTALTKGEIVRRGNRIYTERMELIELELASHIVKRGGYVHANGGDRKSDGGAAGGVGAGVAATGGESDLGVA